MRSYKHKGASYVEIYQNCNIFNDGAFFVYTDKETKKEEGLFLEQGKPLIFGDNSSKGIKLDGLRPTIVNLEEGNSTNDLWIHDEQDLMKAQILARFFDDPKKENGLPRPFGIFYAAIRPTYEEVMRDQIASVIAKKGKGNLDKLIEGNETWVIG